MASIEATTSAITKLYRQAQRDIIFELKSATEYRRKELAVIGRNINNVLDKLGEKRDRLVEKAVEEHYEEGFDRAVGSLKTAGVKGVKATFSVLDTQAIAAIAEEITALLGEADAGALRHSIRMLNSARAQATLSRIARGRLLGKTLTEIKRDVEKELSKGMVVLKDRRGRSWSMDTYAEMVTRTNMTKTTNRGLQNRLASEGADLVMVSNHNSTHEECRVWEHEILSISGETKEWDGKRVHTVDQATNAGLFHPNCKHRLLPYKPEIMKHLT